MAGKAAKVGGATAAFAVAALATFQALTPECPRDTACVSWTPPTQYVDGTPIPSNKVITYTLYRGTAANAVNTQVGTTTATSMQWKNNGATETYYFNVTATVDSMSSDRSNTASKLVRSPGPTDGRIEGPTEGGIE